VVLQDLPSPSRVILASHQPRVCREMGTTLVRPQQAGVSDCPRALGESWGGQPARDTPPFVQVQAREQEQALTHLAMAASDVQPSELASAPRDLMPRAGANCMATRKDLAVNYSLGGLNTRSPSCIPHWQVGRSPFLLCTSPRSRSEAAVTCFAFVPAMEHISGKAGGHFQLPFFAAYGAWEGSAQDLQSAPRLNSCSNPPVRGTRALLSSQRSTKSCSS